MIRNAPLKNYYDEVLKLVPQASASGQIATIDDGAKDCPLKSLVVEIEPIQSGSGTPSPDNVRSISARSEVVVTRAGKNLLNLANAVQGSFNSTTGAMTSSTSRCRLNTPFLIKAGTYILSDSDSLDKAIYVYDVNGNYLLNETDTSWTSGNLTKTFSGDRLINTVWRFPSNDTISPTDLKTVMLEVGSTASAYEPYQGETYTISLGQSVYGGTLDVGKGELVIDKAFATYDGTETWSAHTTRNGFYRKPTGMLIGTRLAGLSNRLPNASTLSEFGLTFGAGNNTLYASEITTTISGVTDVASWKTWLANNPLQVVYPLAEPISVSIDPTEIRTLYGINNIWSDSGETAVTYKANATLLYEKIRNAIISQGGQI